VQAIGGLNLCKNQTSNIKTRASNLQRQPD